MFIKGWGGWLNLQPKVFSCAPGTENARLEREWAMAKNGSTRCFFGQKRMYLKTIAAESVVGRI